MTKIVWHSGSPMVPTGYGSQTSLFAPRLRDLGHEIALSSIYGILGAPVDWEGMTIWPGDEQHGNATLPAIAGRHGGPGCQVITLYDVWPFKPAVFKDLNIACWVPVDHEPCPPRVAQFFELTGARPIAMSRFGERMLRDAGFDPLYVPHGVDTNVYKPFDRVQARKQVGFPEDKFIVGMVANNQGHTPPRKAFPEIIEAFAEFHANHPDTMLYLHTELTGMAQPNPAVSGVDIPKLCERFGVPASAVGFAPQTELALGLVAQSDMAVLYSAVDVLVNTSHGEGFGIPIIEAQACGTPVIVTDWTSMPELCGAGWKVGGLPWYDPQHGAYYMRPSIEGILAAFEAAYELRGDETLRTNARAFAAGYDADLITETYWKPTLEALSKPREVPPLPNRAMRRAAKKQVAA